MAVPASHGVPIHPDRVRAALDGRLTDATVARLLACDRLRGRIANHLGADGAGPGAPAWLIADPAEAARRAGAVLHGRAIRSVLTGPAVAALVAAIGREAHLLGLRHGADARPRDHGGDLAGAILREGEACLGAWLWRRPGPLRAAILLGLPPGTAIEAAADGFEAEADAVMDAVARSYAPAEGGTGD
ncbi:hypothetical protein [Methylobacterium sp. J-076]|uniref:hypothetical protein n=1 Tax=Methylobacterium sp. J-076 TaxID=2836655 RepID=UPI001FB88408|nr:hypothetical protein [Methylobacterium sp. J-076]MCJ2013126.1 hypothetical protein [Methylobacterium sp. J-076]